MLLMLMPMQVQILVENGANVSLQDRWGNDAAAEARRIGATAIVDMLMAKDPASSSTP